MARLDVGHAEYDAHQIAMVRDDVLADYFRASEITDGTDIRVDCSILFNKIFRVRLELLFVGAIK